MASDNKFSFVVDQEYLDSLKNYPRFRFALREDLAGNTQFLPAKEHADDTGWDVRCANPDGVVLYQFEYAKIKLGFRMFTPPGWWVELRPRSSTHAKKQLNCLYGVLDEGWEGECILSVQYNPSSTSEICCRIEFGEKIGQIIPIRRQEMLVTEVTNEEFDKLCSERGSKRGAGGFGSTG